MIQKHINQLNAAKTTVAYCEATSAVCASNTNIAPKVAYIKGRIVVVEGLIQLSDEPIDGVTTNVKAIRATTIEEVLPLASAVFSYAAEQTPPDTDLMAKAKLVKTDLEDCSKEHCYTESQRIVTLATDNAAHILSSGITALILSDAQTTVTLYGNVINSPRAAAISKASAGEQADQVLAEIMNTNLAVQLDAMANVLRFSQNVWWKSYRKSREIIDLGTTFTKIRVDVVDVNDNPIKDVNISLKQAGVIIYHTKTDAQGKASIVKIKPGNYDIYFEKGGFTTQIEADYHFAPGSEKIHHIVLAASGLGPVGFNVQEFHIPSGGSFLIPLSSPSDPVSPTTEVYLLCTNGFATLCTTNIPASPCAGGFQLQPGVPYQGSIFGLNLNLTNTHFQFTNPGPDDITVRVGSKD